MQTKTMQLDGHAYKLDIASVYANPDASSLRVLSYHGCTCILLCYAVNNRQSYVNLEWNWIAESAHYAPNAIRILVGLQCDSAARFITFEEVQLLAQQYHCSTHVEVSAKTIVNVDYLKEVIARLVHVNFDNSMPQSIPKCEIM